jgi:flagellar capping protein FliD
MAISFGGLGNGVDFGQVVSELAKVQRLPIDALTAKKKDLQTKLTDYGALGNKLLALQSAANALRLPSSFNRSTSTVSDDDYSHGSSRGRSCDRQLYGTGHSAGQSQPSDEQSRQGCLGHD